jgi:hypothetical protein
MSFILTQAVRDLRLPSILQDNAGHSTDRVVVKSILFVLADRINSTRPEEGTWPGIRKLAAEAGISTSTLQDALKVLEYYRLLMRMHAGDPYSKHDTDTYRLILGVSTTEPVNVSPTDTFTSDTADGKCIAHRHNSVSPTDTPRIAHRHGTGSKQKIKQNDVVVPSQEHEEQTPAVGEHVMYFGTEEPAACPQCHTGMVVVKARRSDNKKFLGCSRYGEGCRWTGDILTKIMRPPKTVVFEDGSVSI